MHHHVLYIKDTIKTRLVVVDLHAQRLRPNQLSDNKISPWDTRQTATRLHWTHFFLFFCILSVFYHCPLYNPALSNIWELCVWIWHKDVFVKFSHLFGFAGFMYTSRFTSSPIFVFGKKFIDFHLQSVQQQCTAWDCPAWDLIYYGNVGQKKLFVPVFSVHDFYLVF